MGLLGRKKVKIFAVMLFIGLFVPMTVRAKGAFAPVTDKPTENIEDYIVLNGETESYEVLPGDSLWRISEKLWGDGMRYTDLLEANFEIIENPDIIFPGMLLTMQESLYLEKEDGPMGITMGEYWFDMPNGYTVGVLSAGEVWANFTLSGGKMDVACLIRDKSETAEKSMEDWEVCRQQIQSYVEENYKDSVTDLTFERYQTANGDDVYLYSFKYLIDLSLYDQTADLGVDTLIVYACTGVKMTEHIQAEFTGFGFDEEVTDVVRYITASMEEDASYDGDGSVNASNMSISPSYPWKLEGIHNPFPWIAEYYDTVSREIFGME